MKTLGGAQLWTDVRAYGRYRVQRFALDPRRHRLLGPGGRRLCAGSLAACHAGFESRVDALRGSDDPHIVVLLHGLGRTGRSMLPAARALSRHGHHVIPLTYASTRADVDHHAEALRDVLQNLPPTSTGEPYRVSFVTHSLGGIVVRTWLGRHAAKAAAVTPFRLVMFAPPSRGASFASRLPRAVFQTVMGPAGERMAEAARRGMEIPHADHPLRDRRRIDARGPGLKPAHRG